MAAFSLLIIGIVIVSYSVTTSQEKDGLVINLAGRQRMLTQKLTKELFFGIANSTSESSAGDQQKKGNRTGELFDVTLKALQDGGETFTDLPMTKPVTIAGTTNPEIAKQLSSVRKLWNEFAEKTALLQSMPRDSSEYRDNLASINQLSVSTLKAMNKAVGMYQKESDAKTALMQNVQLVALFCSVGLFAIAMYALRKGVVRPIRAIIKGLNEGAETFASTSKEVESASDSLAHGSVAQSDSLDQTVTAIETLSNIAKTNAESASQARSLIEMAQESNLAGNSAVKELEQAMKAIDDSTHEVSKVLSVIDDIAFQTNLLALNAAIEAEGAGSHGKRFAVVAEEVRNLAERCGQAAKQTSSQVESAIEANQSGLKHVGQTVTVFESIADSVKQAADCVGRIDEGSRKQSNETSQISEQIHRIETETQTTAAASEESAGAAKELAVQAEVLNELVEDLVVVVNGR